VPNSVFFSTVNALAPLLRRGELDLCESYAATQLRTLPDSPFHVVLDLEIDNEPAEASSHIDRFVRLESPRFSIKALYAEMNGFDINTDLWYFDLFAYDRYEGHIDYDWLCEWQSEAFDPFAIRGLERLQSVFATNALPDAAVRDSRDVAGILVVIKFQRFMYQAAQGALELLCPLLATAHDYDVIAEVRLE
jgi:hypothetical protein